MMERSKVLSNPGPELTHGFHAPSPLPVAAAFKYLNGFFFFPPAEISRDLEVKFQEKHQKAGEILLHSFWV